jgi:hypothetical protein
VIYTNGSLRHEAEGRNERQRQPARIPNPKPYEWHGKWSNPVLNALAAGTDFGDAVQLAPYVSDKDTQ